MTKRINIVLLIVLIIGSMVFVYKDLIRTVYYNLSGKNPQQTATEELFRLRSSSFVDEDANEISTKAIILAQKASVATTTIQIDSCMTSPSAIKIKYGDVFSFSNIGKGTSTISLPAHAYNLAPGDSVSVKSSDIQAPSQKEAYSLFIYSCSGRQGPAGYIYIGK
ncbi:MAG TPA: hypothetical protein VGE35_00400 [Candidatus Paceibacterota bacterium]